MCTDVLLSGTSATVVIQTRKKIYIAWVGDSLIALQGSEKNINQDFIKSEDLFMIYPPHIPTNQREKIRIYNNRGEIRESPLDGKSRVYMRARMYPALLNSRSLGDLLAHQIGVYSKPQLKIHEILQNDKFFIIGSSTLWDIVAPEEVIDSIAELGSKDKGVYCDFIF